MTNQGQIILRCYNGQWHGLHTGPLGDQVQQLFGTAILPTAYTANAKALDVLAAIKRLNPGTSVILG